MDAKEILAQVKVFFNDLVAPVAAAAPPATPTAGENEYELKIGGKVTIDRLEVGGIVTIDGSPALAGTLELADGTEVVVGDNGVISAVTPAAGTPDAAAAPTVDMTAKFTEFETATNGKFAEYESKFAAYETQFAAFQTKLNKADKVIGELLKLSTLIVEAPAGQPDQSVRSGNAFKEEKKEKDLSILFN